MANKEVVVRLTAKDNFSQTLNKYEREMRGAGTATERLGQSSRQAQGGMNSFTGALKGAAVAMAGMVAIDQIGQLNAIGVAANAASVTFEQLTGGASNASAMLERLRATTNSAVSDFDLMAASNKLLLSGLADTDDEIAKITELSTKLGAAMGKDAASAMDEFNLMLLNQSIPRLDTFGISASAVRERINELTESMGISREEAFKLAVFEEGAIAMDKLGDAADRLQGTALAQLEAKLGNVRDELAKVTSGLIEAGASAVNFWLDPAGAMGVEDNSAAIAGSRMLAEEAAAAFSASYGDYLSQNFYSNELETTLRDITETIARNITLNEAQLANAQTLVAAGGLSGLLAQGYDESIVRQLSQDLTGSDLILDPDLQTAAALQDQIIAGVVSRYDEVIDKANKLATAQDLVRDSVEKVNNTWSKTTDFFSTAMARANDPALRFMDSLRGDLDVLSAPSVSMGLGQGNELIDPSAADAFLQKVGRIESRFEALKVMAEDSEFVDDVDLSNMEVIVNQSRDFADYIKTASDNFKSMSLSELFGQSGGGRLGEFGDMVLANIDDEATREAVARSFNLQSGRETDASIAFEEQISPTIAAIAEQQGADAATAALQRTLTAYEQALLQGMSSADAATVAQQAVGFQLIPGGAGGGFGTGGQFTVNPGDTASGIAAQTGMTIDQVLAAAGVSDPRLLQPGQYGSAGGGAMELVPLEERDLFTTWLTETEETFGGIKETAESTSLEGLKTGVMDAQTETESLKEQLDALSATEYKAKITLEVAMANGLLPNLMGLIDDVVTANGGKVPGTQ